MDFLKLAGLLSFTASAMHIAIIFGGPSWYRFFGAGEGMAQMAEQKLLKPTLITISISMLLAVWGAYAWSGSGLVQKLPFIKVTLSTITAVYLIRGFAGLIAPFVSNHPKIVQNSTSFWVWSSIICILFGIVHLKGVMDKWAVL
jgi:hypothetical protein